MPPRSLCYNQPQNVWFDGDFPFAGQAMAEYRRRSYRRLIVEDHHLIYRVDETLHVVRVLWVQHCRMLPPKAKELKQAEEQ